ncbi:MAG: glutamine--fructose-6-phosphate transaminase (isomerizing) [Clostridia bacterium]|nr:glutamine--fructose-6-phosphate transaminase (isomerizing) [Clostridia bacterium]
MCGIVGYAGERGAADIIYNGLKQLEYRGYDSAGIATLSDGKIHHIKRCGRVNALDGFAQKLSGKVGIGHTRWATHGKPSDNNAHPHLWGKFAIVHNGIIENYAELKEKFFAGVKFLSDTDSEVIVRLLDKFYDGDFALALNKVAALLTGSYAIVAICTDFEGLGVLRRKSPVIIGYGSDGNFAASDAPALAGVCKQISILEDGDCAILTRGKVEIFDSNLRKVQRAKKPNLATAASLDLGDCPHYMLKEIREVPASVVNTCAAFQSVESSLKQALRGVTRVIITGCGTAYNSGLVAKRYIEKFARIPTEVEIAGEFRYKDPVITSGTVIIAVSQSGETADTVEATLLAKASGAKVIAVTNAPYSSLTRCADVVVPVAAGPEICVAATKSYTGQLAALYMLAYVLAGKSADGAAENISAVPKLCKKTLECADIDSLADMCVSSRGVYFLGRDLDFAVATEGSLKLKEVSYIQSEGYPAGELKHGTLALIDESILAVVLITSARLAGKSENAVEQVLSRKGKVAVITNVESVIKRYADRAHIVKVPECEEDISPFVAAVAAQRLAYAAAVKLNRDPDKPRNLAKSVTVE